MQLYTHASKIKLSISHRECFFGRTAYNTNRRKLLKNLNRILRTSVKDFRMIMLFCSSSIWSPGGNKPASTLIPTCISNYMPSKVRDKFTYPLPNFNVCTVEVWEWIRNFIPHFYAGCNYLSTLGSKLIHVNKRGPEWWCDSLNQGGP